MNETDVRKHNQGAWDKLVDQAELLASRAAESCAYVKSEGFRTESEVRLCVAPSYEIGSDAPMWSIKYRASQNRLVPFIVFEFESNVVDVLRLGPFASHDTNRHAAANMLTAWGYKEPVSVRSSDLKLR